MLVTARAVSYYCGMSYTFSLTPDGDDTVLRATSEVAAPSSLLFAWHEREGAFERLAPPWEDVHVVERSGGIREGGRAVIDTKIGPVTQRWIAEHHDYIEGEQFRDVQVKGPFTKWEHTHRVEKVDNAPNRSRLVDEIRFRAPLAPLSNFVVHGRLETMFRYRHQVTCADVERHVLWGAEAVGKKRVLVSGASGLIGRVLVAMLQGGGHEVIKLVRKPPKDATEIQWNADVPSVSASALEGFDAVVHLAGENVGEGKWTEERKAALKQSRIASTRLIAETLAHATQKPGVLVCASGTGIYGDTGETNCDENGARGTGFLAELAAAWEDAAESATSAGIRVVHARIGAVLTPQGGMLEKVLPVFRSGLGGPIAGGNQYLSWIGIDDVAYALYRAVVDDKLSGGVNMVCPEAVPQKEFAKALGHQLHRPAFVPVPRVVLTALYGELAEETALLSSRTTPAKLLALGHPFAQPSLAETLAHVLPS